MRAYRLMRVGVLVAIAACGDNIEPDPNVARSGLRLKLVHYDYGEGTRETETGWFHDAARDERCTPRMWSDGVTICTPDFTDTSRAHRASSLRSIASALRRARGSSRSTSQRATCGSPTRCSMTPRWGPHADATSSRVRCAACQSLGST